MEPMKIPIGRREFLKLVSLFSLIPFFGAERTTNDPKDYSSDNSIPNVFIIVFDTLSALHMPLSGYPRLTAPNMVEFAKRATIYHAHYSPGNFTVPGTASLLTGTYPWSHRALHHTGIMSKPYEQLNLFDLFAETHQTIAFPQNLWANLLLHQLRDDIDQYIDPASYCLIDDVIYNSFLDTDVAFRSFEDLLFREFSVSGSLFVSLANVIKGLFDERIGLRGYSESFPRGVPTLGTYNVFFLLEHVINGILSNISQFHKPFLAYLHFFPPHEPYCPHKDFMGIFNDSWIPVPKAQHVFSPGLPDDHLNRMRMEYDEYIAYTDNEFGKLINTLEESGLLDNSYIILTSDHGQLFERGVHGHDTRLLYEPIIRVPLMISEPGQQACQDVYSPTSSVDIVPTLLHLFGRDIPPWVEGKPLPQIGNTEAASDRNIFAIEAKSNAMKAPLTIGTAALLRGRYKLIHYFGYPGYENETELYDLENDPDELEELSQSRVQIANTMKADLQDKLTTVNSDFE